MTMEFCTRLLQETGVACAPGVDFDPVDGHRFMRFSFAVSTRRWKKPSRAWCPGSRARAEPPRGRQGESLPSLTIRTYSERMRLATILPLRTPQAAPAGRIARPQAASCWARRRLMAGWAAG
jgi:hypothetical protein